MPFAFDIALITLTALGLGTSRELGGFVGGFVTNIEVLAVCTALGLYFF